MNAFLTVIRHEVKKLFKDKKALMSIVVMPIFCGFIAMMTSSLESGSKDYTIWFAGCAVDETTQEVDGGITLSVKAAGTSGAAFVTDERFKKTDVLVDMEKGEIVYNSAGGLGSTLLYMAKDLIDEAYRASFEAMAGSPEHTVILNNTSEEMDTGTFLMAMFLPYMMILMLFTNVLSYASDSIAGEKERGSFEKTLLTPVDPKSVILGKTCSGIVIGLVSTVMYVVTLALFSAITGSESLINFGAIDSEGIALIALCAVIIAYLFSTILVLCSLFAKSSKAARTNALPIMAVSLALALFSMMRAGTVELKMYCVPIYNICILIQDILMGQAEVIKMLVSTVSLLVCAVIAFVISVRAFNSERIRC